MTEKYKELLKNYKVVEKVDEILKEMTIDEAIEDCDRQLTDIDNFSGQFFGDCVGHAQTCLRLMKDNLISRK